jgi:hypothetical protein
LAGFAVLIDEDTPPQERECDFQCLLETTARFKGLELPDEWAIGRGCTAAKLDALLSLQRGICRDTDTGSWLLAAGSIIPLTGGDPAAGLVPLLRDYIGHGIDALQHWDGHFGLVIYNGLDGSISLISDPMGLFAIYYGRQGRQVYISSSALAVAHQTRSHADPIAIECFLRTGRPYGEKTLWQDVKRVRPATVLKFTLGWFTETEYWSPNVDRSVTRQPLREVLERANEVITRNFKIFLQREGKVWADLTGGFDTRLTAMFMAQSGIPFVAYCVGQAEHPDVQVSRRICQEMSWEYQHMFLPDGWQQEQCEWFETAVHRGDGHLSAVQLASILKGSNERSRSYQVHISGTGADEWRYHVYGSKTFVYSHKSSVNYDDILDSRVFFPIPITAMRQDRTIEARAELIGHLRRLESRCADEDVLTRTDVIFLRHRHPIHGGAYLSAESGTLRALMPFCLKELESLCLSLNHRWRIIYHYSFVRNLLEMGNPQLANIRTAKGDPAAPIRLANLHRFGLLWIFLADLLICKVSRNLLGKQLSFRSPSLYPEYPLPAWKTAWLRWSAAGNLLTPDKMRSGSLYNAPVLGEMVAQGLAGHHRTGEFLDRVITVEMALRAAESSLD